MSKFTSDNFTVSSGDVSITTVDGGSFVNYGQKLKTGLLKPIWTLKLKKEWEVDLKGLKNKNKKELEKLGRKVGIELDRRLTKSKLINKIKKHIK